MLLRPLCCRADGSFGAAKGHRAFFVGKYLALRKVEGDVVVVVHMFHQAQNYASLV